MRHAPPPVLHTTVDASMKVAVWCTEGPYGGRFCQFVSTVVSEFHLSVSVVLVVSAVVSTVSYRCVPLVTQVVHARAT